METKEPYWEIIDFERAEYLKNLGHYPDISIYILAEMLYNKRIAEQAKQN
jgi:hypothetical protein